MVTQIRDRRTKIDLSTPVVRLSSRQRGIQSNDIKWIFEGFYRTGSDPSVRGTGRGLNLSRLFTDVQVGQISASSSDLERALHSLLSGE